MLIDRILQVQPLGLRVLPAQFGGGKDPA